MEQKEVMTILYIIGGFTAGFWLCAVLANRRIHEAQDKAERWYLQRSKLFSAARKLYFAGLWTCPKLSIDEQLDLWESLRDALELPLGSATDAGVGADDDLIAQDAARRKPVEEDSRA